MWMPRTESRSSARTSVLNCCAISPALNFGHFQFDNLLFPPLLVFFFFFLVQVAVFAVDLLTLELKAKPVFGSH